MPTKFVTACALSLLFVVSAHAADAQRWRVSLLASEISTSKVGFFSDETRAGLGLGLAYVPSPEWDVELTASSRSQVSPYTKFVDGPSAGLEVPTTEFRRYRVLPVDLSVTRYFMSDARVTPYLRAGVRHVRAPRNPDSLRSDAPFSPAPGVFLTPVQEGYNLSDRTSGQAGAGVRLRLTPRVGVRVEGTRLLRKEPANFDPLTRFAAGISWAF